MGARLSRAAEQERGKQEVRRRGLHVRQRIIDIYAKRGFDSIDPADLRGRFRWYGLYTAASPRHRRRQDRHPRTGGQSRRPLLHAPGPHRTKLGQLSSEALRVISDISVKYARGTADVTDRQNIQLHWIEIESVPAIWEALEAVGLSTTEACGDTPRVIMGCPLAGLDSDELIDATPEIAAVVEQFIGDPSLSNLPRKFKSSISGCAAQCTHHEINDVAFAAVRHPETGEIGYDLWVGGGLSTNPMIAKRLGAFVRAGQVPEVWAAVAAVFRDYGYRRLRHRARIKFLIADWGAEKFREVMEKEYLEYALPDGPAPVDVDSAARDHIGGPPLAEGRPILRRVRATRRTGQRRASRLDRHARRPLRQRPGADHRRAEDGHPRRAGRISGRPDRRTGRAGLPVKPSVFPAAPMACTGIEFCKLAIVETKGRAMTLIDELERRLPDFESPVTINVNGCPNSCARIKTADIGLKGSLVTDASGNQVEGFQIHLGGTLTGGDATGSGFGRKVRGLKATAQELPDYVERVLRRYDTARSAGETFAAWTLRASDEELS